MKHLTLVLAIAAVASIPVVVWVLQNRTSQPEREVTLFGNLDLRQVDLAFNNSERIATVSVQEGDRVRKGQILSELDLSRLSPPVAQAEAQVSAQRAALDRLRNGSRPEEIAQARAQVASQQAVVDRLRHGSRPEEIAEARANVDLEKADVIVSRLKYERYKDAASSSGGLAVSQQDVDTAKAALDSAIAKLNYNEKALELAIEGPRKEDIAQAEATLANLQKALDLAVLGPRKEDIAQAEAVLQSNEAQLALLRRVLDDSKLAAPCDAVVRSRIMEPGEMASPQKPVLSLAIVDPKWVRAYATEVQLGMLHPGMPASIQVESFPQKRFEGWIGFISPVAEFTPKPVQTEELRTSLVYEIRVFVKDPDDSLRLGMPATVHVPLDSQPSQPGAVKGL